MINVNCDGLMTEWTESKKLILKHNKKVLKEPTQTQAAAHLRSMHRRGPELTGQLKCAGAASYRL